MSSLRFDAPEHTRTLRYRETHMNLTSCATLLLSMWINCALLQAQAPAAAAGAASSQFANANLAYEPVGPGDLLYVSVTGSPELSTSYRIAEDGTISIPLLRTRIHVSGLLSPAISEAVSRELVRERVLVEPIVSVAVVDYRSRTGEHCRSGQSSYHSSSARKHDTPRCAGTCARRLARSRS